MALNPEDLRGFELLDEPEDPPPPATLLVQSDRKVENKYNKQDLVGNEGHQAFRGHKISILIQSIPSWDNQCSCTPRSTQDV